MIHEDLQLETKETNITLSLQKKGRATMHFYYKKQFNYFVYKKKKNPKKQMNQQNYRNGCKVVTLVICDSKRPQRAVLNYI